MHDIREEAREIFSHLPTPQAWILAGSLADNIRACEQYVVRKFSDKVFGIALLRCVTPYGEFLVPDDGVSLPPAEYRRVVTIRA